MEGVIFDIQKFCLNDGPGIRSIVFLKGCMLRCKWCHNPESKSAKTQLKFLVDKCVCCGLCQKVCPNGVHRFKGTVHIVDYSKCQGCNKCQVCPTSALSLVGSKVSANEVVNQLEHDRKFYEKSGGGITISGGEPMFQPKFTIEIAKEAKKRGLHVVVETSGAGKLEYYKIVKNYTDIFYFDYKMTGEDNYRKHVGIDSRYILKNLDYLCVNGSKVVLRCPLIPNYNCFQEHLKNIANIYVKYDNIIKVEILPYHPLGESKANNMGIKYDVISRMPTDEEVNFVIDYLKGLGVANITKG